MFVILISCALYSIGYGNLLPWHIFIFLIVLTSTLIKKAICFISGEPSNVGQKDCVNMVTANENFGAFYNVVCTNSTNSAGVICKKEQL